MSTATEETGEKLHPASPPQALPSTIDPRPRPSLWRNPIQWFWRMQDTTSSSAPTVRSLWAVALIVGGFGVNEAYGWARSQIVDPDEYLKDLSAKQDKSFDELKQGLNRLSSAVSFTDREALDQVEAASRSIRDANLGLISQLDLAKRENERLAQVGGQQAGVRGGYDLMLTENTGMVLEPGVVLGVNTISTSWIGANLSANGAPEGSQLLESGESMPYRNMAGANCKVTLLSISGSGGAAAFSKSCG